MYKILILITLTIFSITLNAKDDKPKRPISEKIKFRKAKTCFLDRNYEGAIIYYKELLFDNKKDAEINYLLGEAYLEKGDYNSAKLYISTAYSIDPKANPNIELYMGRIFQYFEEYDKALQSYEAFKSKLTYKTIKKEEGILVFKLIKQCEFIKEQLANPKNVTISNLGPAINSEFSDNHPSMTADGSTMIFTSRRSDSEGGLIASDGEYYQDIYITTFDNEKGMWNIASKIPGSVNTPGHDANCSISPDGTKIFTFQNLNAKGGDIFVSKYKYSGSWTKPKELDKPINSTYYDDYACLSSDGNTLYFVSERKKNFGKGDLFKTNYLKDKKEWSKPVNAGGIINSEESEISVFIHPDGKTMFFSSKGHKNMGGFDIFMSTRDEKGEWTKPVNLGYPINTSKDEKHFVISTDWKTAYYTTNGREDSYGKDDIYEIDMTKYFGIKEEVVVKEEVKRKLSIVRGKVVEANDGTGVQAVLRFVDVATNQEVAEINANESGEYFVTLESMKKYKIIVEQDNYKTVTEEIDLPEGDKGTYSLVKHIIIEKNQ